MRRRTPALALMISAALAMGFAGCGDDDEPTSGSSSGGEAAQQAPPEQGGEAAGGPAAQAATVDIKEFKYEPVTVSVTSGGTVTWVNGDAAPHTATAEDQSFDTGSLDKGDDAKVTFDKPGTFAYICTFHPFMSATVEVVE